MASTALVTKVLSPTKPPEPTVLGCRSSNEEIIKRSTDLSFGVLIAILNIVEIIMIAKIRRKKNICEILLLSLSVSDCMFGISNLFVSIPFIANLCTLKEFVETAYTFYVFFVLTSIFHLLFIAVDRLVAVLKPLKHKIYLSRRRFYTFLTILWILAVIISALLQILDKFTDTFERKKFISKMSNQTLATTSIPSSKISPRSVSPQNNLVVVEETSNSFKSDMQLSLSVMIILADVTMVMSYSLIIYLTTFKTKKVASTQKQSNRLPVICIAIASIFVLFTLPYAIATFVLGVATFWPNFILVLSSGVNSIVYFFRIKISRYCKAKKKQDIKFNSHLQTSSLI